MPVCCPQRRGCNSSVRLEPCILELCRRTAGVEPLAATAVARWEVWQAASRSASKQERRFRRRAYERARDDELVALLMHAQSTHAPT
jgi:hypothetical protein